MSPVTDAFSVFFFFNGSVLRVPTCEDEEVPVHNHATSADGNNSLLLNIVALTGAGMVMHWLALLPHKKVLGQDQTEAFLCLQWFSLGTPASS